MSEKLRFRNRMMPESAEESSEAPHLPAVLVVDDNALIRLTLSDYLQDHGFKVLEASTGDEALAIMAAPGFAVSLVFTDIMMPGVTDGLALAKWIAENQPTVPVVLTSGDEEKAKAAKELGSIAQFVPKPYVLEEVAALIQSVIGPGAK